ncbi:MAG TPA: hypothetical protein VLH39_08785 [Magnetospirillaceae bacterium]|nr:hypothetical protein [Magnetospirillaceae bacterium]
MRKLLALALYIFIGLPAILGTLFLVPARAWILERDFYRSFVSGLEARTVLETPSLYEALEGTLQVAGGLSLSGPAAGKALRASLPVPEVLAAAGSAVDSLFDALESGQYSAPREGRIPIVLIPIRTALDSAIPEFARVYAEEVPESSAPSPAGPGAWIGLDLTARPPDVTEQEFRAVVQGALRSAVAQIPDTAEGVLVAPGRGLPGWGITGNPRDALNRAAVWMSLLAGGVWIAGAFVASDSAGKRLRWLGRTLLWPGIAALAAGAGIRLAADPLVISVLQGPELLRALPEPALEAILAWVHPPLRTVSAGVLVSGSLAVILGGGLLASRKALRYRDLG